MKIIEVEIKHVRRRVQRAQRAIQRQRRRVQRLGHALRRHHLHNVAFEDIFFRALHCSVIRLPAKARHRRFRDRGAVRRNDHRRTQLFQQFGESCARAAECIRHSRLGVHHEKKLARKIIDNGYFFRHQQRNVGRAKLIRLLRVRKFLFDIAHGVVAKVADQSATKARQFCRIFDGCDLETRKISFDVMQRVVNGALLCNRVA